MSHAHPALAGLARAGVGFVLAACLAAPLAVQGAADEAVDSLMEELIAGPDAAKPAPEPDRGRIELTAAAQRAAVLLQALRLHGYRGESALDILQLDIEEITTGGAAAPELQVRVDTFAALCGPAALAPRTAELAALRTRLADALAADGRISADAAAQFTQQLSAWSDAFTALTNECAREERALRAELAARRPPRPVAAETPAAWLRSRFHLCWLNHYGLEPPGLDDAIRTMGAMGSTCLIERYPVRFHAARGETTTQYLDHVAAQLQREDMRMFLAYPSPAGWLPAWKDKFLAAVDECLTAGGDRPAFAGLQFDEIHLTPYRDRVTMRGLRDYLRAKYKPEELMALGVLQAPSPRPSPQRGEGEEVGAVSPQRGEGEEVPDALEADALLPPDNQQPTANNPPPEPRAPFASLDELWPPLTRTNDVEQVLWTAHREYCREAFVELARDVFDYAHARKPGSVMFALLSPAQVLSAPFHASVPLLAPLADVMALDPYWNGVPEEALFCDLMRSCAKGPVLLTAGMCYGARTPASVARDLAISFAHADGVYIFDWPWCYKHPPYLKPEWKPLWLPEGKWDVVERFARKAQRLEPYLVDAASPAAAALLFSERSSAIQDPNTLKMEIVAGPYRVGFMGLYCLLGQAKLQVDARYIEGSTLDTLTRYRVLILPNAACLTVEDEALLREWVRRGGHLIATASSSLRDRWGRRRATYGLSDVFGVRYVGPGRGVTNLVCATPATYSPEFGYDRVEPTTGAVLARWGNGDPAVVSNAVGAGRCVFVTAEALGACYQGTPRGEEIRPYFAVYKRFFAGVPDFVAGLVREGLAAQGVALPFRVAGAPPHVEVVMRTQRTAGGGPRRILHLLNYGAEEPVAGVELRVPAGGDAAVRAFYAEDNQPAACERAGTELVIRVRDFGVHEAVVVEGRQP